QHRLVFDHVEVVDAEPFGLADELDGLEGAVAEFDAPGEAGGCHVVAPHEKPPRWSVTRARGGFNPANAPIGRCVLLDWWVAAWRVGSGEGGRSVPLVRCLPRIPVAAAVPCPMV